MESNALEQFHVTPYQRRCLRIPSNDRKIELTFFPQLRVKGKLASYRSWKEKSLPRTVQGTSIHYTITAARPGRAGQSALKRSAKFATAKSKIAGEAEELNCFERNF